MGNLSTENSQPTTNKNPTRLLQVCYPCVHGAAEGRRQPGPCHPSPSRAPSRNRVRTRRFWPRGRPSGALPWPCHGRGPPSPIDTRVS